MAKKLFINFILIPLLLFANSAFAQQTNANEDYSVYLPEVRAFNQELARMSQLQGPSLLTKKGLAAARNSMAPDSSVKTQLQPSVKYITGTAGKLALRIFKPDTIRAVVLDIHGGGWSVGTAAGDDLLNDQMARACKEAAFYGVFTISTLHTKSSPVAQLPHIRIHDSSIVHYIITAIQS